VLTPSPYLFLAYKSHGSFTEVIIISIARSHPSYLSRRTDMSVFLFSSRARHANVLLCTECAKLSLVLERAVKAITILTIAQMHHRKYKVRGSRSARGPKPPSSQRLIRGAHRTARSRLDSMDRPPMFNFSKSWTYELYYRMY
jgi:hypothetical protein